MSSSLAEIWTRAGRLVGFGDWHATADTLSPLIVDRHDQVWEAHRHGTRLGGWDALADCDHDPIEGWVITRGGIDTHWPIMLCPACGIVIGPLNPRELTDLGRDWPREGLPDGITAAT